MDQLDQHIKAMTSAGLNLIGQALSIYDSDLQLVLCNRRFQEMFTLPDALTTPGASFKDTIRFLAQHGEYEPETDVDAIVQSRVEQALAFEPHYIERSRPNGQVISVEGAPLPQGGWVAVYTDITRTKRAEELLRSRSEELSDQLLNHAEELSATNRALAATISALEEAKRQLTESERRTRLTTEMMPAHIAHVDTGGRYTFSNRRLSSVLPGRPSDILGMHISQALGQVTYDRIEASLNDAYNGTNAVLEFTEAHDQRRIRVAFTPDRSGGVYILSMDITEETQTRVALQQSRRRSMAAQMTSGLAHDFSNLLTIILGMQGKLEKMELAPEATEMVQATLSAARRGGRLLNRIADMTGKRTIRPRATTMAAVLEELKVLASPSLPRTIGLSILDNTDNARLLLDLGMVQDALLNLVLNARDACAGSGQITVSAHPVGKTWLDITVTDTGPGFSQDALDKALNPFFTTKGSEGSGLGLPMVYDMVKLAGGSIRLGNTRSGASVRLRLPFRLAPQAQGGMALLVEDNEDLRTAFRDMLITLGFSVIEATSVDEASALVADLTDISIVLSDIRLEGAATGLDLADRMAQSEIPVILMTSLPSDDALYQSALTKCPVLAKPFTQSQLAALIEPETPT
ncbi:MAG: PAS-domain containing protein [Paracoccaceae bacterium]